MDLEVWLAPVSEDSPCGPNLEYDPEFQQLEEAAKEKPDQEFGGDGAYQRIEGASADWSAVRKLAESLITRTKDLRVAVYLLQALLATEGFKGMDVGARLIHGLLERYWDKLHPELDADDNDDPTMRVNALSPLASTDAVVATLRSAWVVRSRQHGVLTVRDIEVMLGKMPARENGPQFSELQIAAMIGEAIKESPELVRTARSALDTTKAISSLLIDRVGAAASLDLKQLVTTLYGVQQQVQAAAPSGDQTATAAVEEGAESGSGSSATVVIARSGEIRSREDVVTTLDRICEYLSRTEPTSPVPILLRRAQRMMGMSFLELINDMAPDGLPQAERVVGQRLDQ
ncbi:type VI secretion system protein TssA [Niveibacterium sp. SC-1]|uniref:type VI secretion system protein TssA n=1 Tax=Niveibacterium sp. SC-1 TaxID=3135646 RepID=UPI00311EDAB7